MRKPAEPSYPSITPSVADFVFEKIEKGESVVNELKSVNGDTGYTSEEEELRFAPPGYIDLSKA